MVGCKKRGNIGIELLRIITMLIIIAWHYSIYSGFSYEVYHPNVLWLNAICGGSTGNAIFIMISGFFLGNKTSESQVKWGKICRLLLLASFYSIVFWAILGNHSISGFTELIKTLRSVVFPYVYGEYWFIAGYLIIYILHPFINMLINCMNQDAFRKLLWITIIITVLFPSLIGSTESFSNILEMFVLYYLIGAYISRYKVYDETPGWKILLILIASIMIRVGLIYSSYHFSSLIGFISWNDLLRRMKNSYYVFNILIAVMFLMAFAKVRINNKTLGRIIKIVSSTVLGIYLIHDNQVFRPILWNFFGASIYENSYRLLTNCLISVVTTFIFCMIVELLRRGITYIVLLIVELNSIQLNKWIK